MTPKIKLKQLEEWVRSDDFVDLIGAYKEYHERGIIGRPMQQGPAILDERGVLLPERFEQYMLALQSRVLTALRTNREMVAVSVEDSRDLTFLANTLTEMFECDALPNTPYDGGKSVRELFKQGKQMGFVLSSYFAEINSEHGIPRPGGRRA